MVAQKRGRGRGAAAAKAKAAPVEEQPVELEEPMETAEDNGDVDQTEQLDESVLLEEGGDEQAENQDKPNESATEDKPEEKQEEKVETGRLLIENLPLCYLFEYQEKLKEIFSKYGEVTAVKRGPVIVTEQTTTPTLSAIVVFKNKDSLEKAVSEAGTVLEGNRISVSIECRAEMAVLVGVPYETSIEYVKNLFSQCGDIVQILEFSKTKYKILRVTFQEKEAAERALRLDRELRINGFLVTVTKYRDEDEHKQSNNAKKRQNAQSNQARNGSTTPANNNNSPARNNYRGRGAAFQPRGGNFRGGRGRGAFPARGGAFPRGGFAPPAYPLPGYMPPRPGGFMNDGQRPNKRLRQM